MVLDGPQLENGYVRIANELLDAILRAGLSKREILIVFAVIRKTYGFGKKSDDMTMTQLAEITGIQRPHVGLTVSALKDKNVLLIQYGKYGQVIGINKNYKKWIGYQNSTCTETVNLGYQNSTHKRQSQKTTNISARKAKIPDGFELTPERLETFQRIAVGHDAENEFQQFTDHHRAHGKAMLDWDAAWRTWCRNVVKFNGVKNGSNQNSGRARSAADRVAVANPTEPDPELDRYL